VGWSICNTAYARSFDLLKLVEVFEIIGRHELLFSRTHAALRGSSALMPL
jgi:hypothetical protein